MSHSAHATETFRCCVVRKSDDGIVSASIEQQPLTKLPEGNVRIRVQRSSLNYKDALAVTGHRGLCVRFRMCRVLMRLGLLWNRRIPTSLSAVQSSRRDMNWAWTLGRLVGVHSGSVFVGVASARWPDDRRSHGDRHSRIHGGSMCRSVDSPRRASRFWRSTRHRRDGWRGEFVDSDSVAAWLPNRCIDGQGDQADWLQRIGATRVMLRDELLKAPNRLF